MLLFPYETWFQNLHKNDLGMQAKHEKQTTPSLEFHAGNCYMWK